MIVINTFKRSELLLEVLEQIPKEKEILIFQDGCSSDYNKCKKYLKDYKYSWYRYRKPHGKKMFWALWNDIFKILKTKNFESVHFLSDDTIPTEDYWYISEKVNVDCLNTLVINSHNRLFAIETALFKIDKYKVYNIGRIDCAFMCKKSFFELLNWEMLPVPDNFDFERGSGVGYYMSERYKLNGGKIHNIFPSLLEHKGFESVMGNKRDIENITSILPQVNNVVKAVGVIEIPKMEKIPKIETSIKRIIWALDSSYAGVSFISNYLNAKIIMYNRRREDFDNMMWGFLTYKDNEKEVLELLSNAKELLLFGAKGVQYLIPILKNIGKSLKDYKITTIITDSWYIKDRYLNNDIINKELKKCKDVRFLFMPDCVKYKADFIKEFFLYYQYLPIPQIEAKKQLMTSHSPGLKVNTNEKGTEFIKSVCKEVGLKLNIIHGKAWSECLEEKAKSIIFIDQIICKENAKKMNIETYDGGLGKSGLEAMKLGNIVLTSGKLYGNKELPKAPVIIANEKTLKKELFKLKNMSLKELQKIGEKNKAWAEKYTSFEYALKTIDPTISRVEQIRVSETISFYRDKIKDKYNLGDYKYKTKTALFWGLYFHDDYEAVKNHKNKAIVMFAGSDVDYFGNVYYKYKSELLKHRIIAISENIQKRVREYGVESEYIPITPTAIVKNVYSKQNANCVYFYGRSRNYGMHLLPEIESRIKFKIIKTDAGTYDKKELEKVYKKCFVGLRLTEKDGLSNTIVEMGLMGRRVLHNPNNLPNTIKYKDVDDIVKLINTEYELRNEDNEYIADNVYNYLNINDFWLYI